jgi:RNA polymerase sigma factor (sigma-70 family)
MRQSGVGENPVVERLLSHGDFVRRIVRGLIGGEAAQPRALPAGLRRLRGGARAALPGGDAVERARETRGALDAVLALEDPLRTVVLLRHFDGLSAEEIAARCGVTPATVRERLARATAVLRGAAP